MNKITFETIHAGNPFEKSTKNQQESKSKEKSNPKEKSKPSEFDSVFKIELEKQKN